MVRIGKRQMAVGLVMGALLLGNAHAGKAYLDGLEQSGSFNQFIVQYKPQSSASRTPGLAAQTTHALGASMGVAVQHARRMGIGADVIRLQDKPMNAGQARAFLLKAAAHPDVEYVQVDALMQPQFVPNDTRYTEQWHYKADAAGLNLEPAWNQSTGAGVIVAVVDTGITPHSDLNANVIAGYDMITDLERARDGDGRDANPRDEGDWRVSGDCGGTTTSDSSWHGTHTAGTVGAITNNGIGVSGVAFGAKIQPVRVMGKCGGSISDIADGVTWASGGSVPGVPLNANPARVINMSLGGSGACDPTYQTAIDGAVSRGTVVVVAAGNSNVDAANHRPANCNNVIAVASLDRDGNRAFYSNFGPKVDIAAPGGETATTGYGVLSTFNTGLTVPAAERYAFKQGTSMAAPHIAGLSALMLAKNRSLSPAQIESTMKANTRALVGSCTGGCGAGVADATKTLNAITSSTNNPPVANFAFSTNVLTATFTDTSTDVGGSIAARSWAFGDGSTSTLANPTRTYAVSGTYNVTLTVTDNQGASASVTKAVTVSNGNAPPVANFTFTVSGLTASFTDTSTDAGGSIASRSWTFGDGGTSTLANPSRTYAAAGTFNVTLSVSDNLGASASVTKAVTVSTAGPLFQNTTDYPINDNSTVDSPITVSGVAGNAPSALKVSINIVHTWPTDLRVDLVAPDGSMFNLHNRTSTTSPGVVKTVTINASTEVANGVWKLRVNDNAGGDTGYINSWSMQF